MVLPAQFSRLLHVSVALTALLFLCGCSPQVVLTTAGALLGDSEAQYNLGVMYQNGQGVTQDYAETLKWYRKAAEQGLATAQYSLGEMYKKGLGVKKDRREARKWFEKARKQGYTGP